MPRFLKDGNCFIKHINILDKEYKIMITTHDWEKYGATKISDHVSYWVSRMRKGKKPVLKYGNYMILNDETENTKYKCSTCDIDFANRSSYNRHLKSETHNANQLKIIDEMPTSIEELQNIRMPINQNSNNNTTNNIQINITAPREFNKENPRWLTQEVLLDAIRDVTTAIPKLIKAKHFNDKYPENNNIRLGDRRDIKKRLKVFQDDRWTIEDRGDLTDKLMYGVYDILDEIFTFFRGEGEEGFHTNEMDEMDETELHNYKVLESLRRSENAGRIISRVLDKWKYLAAKFGDKDDKLLEKINDRFDTILLDNELKISQLKDKINPRLYLKSE